MKPQLVSFAELGLTPDEFRQRALRWAAGFAHCAYFEPNELSYPQGPFTRLLAVATTAGQAPAALAELQAWLEQASVLPRVGFLTYDLKNEIEALHSAGFSGFDWPPLHFFQPQTWLQWQADTVTLHGETAGVLAAILATPLPASSPPTVLPLRPRLPKAEYLRAVEAVRNDILDGEVYELNLCQEFYAEGVTLDPVDVFLRLNEVSPAPFAGFLRWQEHFLLCASPERFLAHRPPLLLSQPIKGTSRRGADPAEDERQRQFLLHDEKERAENLMIVDLVRNHQVFGAFLLIMQQKT